MKKKNAKGKDKSNGDRLVVAAAPSLRPSAERRPLRGAFDAGLKPGSNPNGNGILQGLKPTFLSESVRPKAEALGYLEATAREKATARATASTTATVGPPPAAKDDNLLGCR